jgi:Kef-type K+ transport system membrane component KefB
MIPRGEVGIVVAGLGLSTRAIDGSLYSVVVGMAVITTLIVPPFLPALVRRAEGQQIAVADDDEEDDAPLLTEGGLPPT